MKCKYDPVPIKDMQTPSPSEVAIMTWKMFTVLNRMKNHISDFSFFYLFKFMLITFTIYGATSHDQKNNLFEVAKFTERMRIDLTRIFWFMSFFCATFNFWDGRYGRLHHFLLGDTPHVCKIDHIQNRPYLKN